MDNASKEMRHLVEKAGRCWHEVADANGGCVYDPVNKTVTCFKCGKAVPITPNPSPHSMDALLELAKELNLVVSIVQDPMTDSSVKIYKDIGALLVGPIHNNETADALRLAMCRATAWKEVV